MKKINKIWWLVIVVIGLMIALHPYFRQGVPDTHDGNNHLVRFASYKMALKQGQFPPRWAPNLLQHYGYPVFNFNYPLANLLSLPFSILKIPYEIIFKVLSSGFLLIGAISLKLWLELLIKNKTAVLVATLGWLFFPFIISTVYFRGNIGEIAAYGLVPLLLFITELMNQKRLTKKYLVVSSFVFAAFLLSHNITVVFFIPLLLVYALLRFELKKIAWLQLLMTLIIGVLLTLWFWLPAIAEMSQTNVTRTGLTREYSLHFPTLVELLNAPLTFGYSYPGGIDGLSFNIGILTVLSIILAIVYLASKTIKKSLNKESHLLLWFSLAALILVVLQLSISDFIWRMIPVAQIIQFPWRLSLFLGVITAYLVARLWAEGVIFKIVLFIGLLVLVRNTLVAVPYKMQHQDNEKYDQSTISTSILSENTPHSFLFETFSEAWEPRAKVYSGNATIIPKSWTGTKREYLVSVESTATIIEPTANFSGWETWIQSSSGNERVLHVDDDVIRGRIAYILEPGEYQVETKFTQNTTPRLIGNFVSVTTLIVCLALLLKYRNE